MLTPTALAFVGDAVYTLYIRRILVENGCAGGTLHTSASGYVNAKAQAAAYDELVARGELSAEEEEIARRAKNAHLRSRAKTASSADYHKATALESVLGYLELIGNVERRDRILTVAANYSKNPEELR